MIQIKDAESLGSSFMTLSASNIIQKNIPENEDQQRGSIWNLYHIFFEILFTHLQPRAALFEYSNQRPR